MSRSRALALTLLVLVAAGACVRLGFWQLSRLHQKQAVHAAQRAALAAVPIELAGPRVVAKPAAGHRVHVRGQWDTRAHVLLSGRTYLSAAGVELATPVVLAGGERVLVHRGWMAASDARIAHPERYPDSSADVVGVALPFEHSARPSAWVALPAESAGDSAGDSAGIVLWSARTLEADTVLVRLGSPLADWYVRVLPDPALPRRLGTEAAPEAIAWEVPDETMHLSYALQWFAIALVIVGGSLALAIRRMRSAPGS